MRRRAVGRASALLTALAVVAGLGVVWFATAGVPPLGDAAVAVGAVALGALVGSVAAATRFAVALLGLGTASVAPPARPVDLAVVIAQSRPDASGRPRPRAPGLPLQAV